MRRFIVGWKQLGYARRFGAHIVCYADDLSIFGRGSAPQMLTVVERMMDQLQLPINHSKTRCLRCPQEPMEFLGYRIGKNYRSNGSVYIGTRPSKASVQNLCRKVSEQTSRKHGLMDSQEMVKRLNWMLSGWSNYFYLGQGQSCLRGDRSSYDQTAATMVLSEASGKSGEICAILRQ